jgi:hypothetical protein
VAGLVVGVLSILGGLWLIRRRAAEGEDEGEFIIFTGVKMSRLFELLAPNSGDWALYLKKSWDPGRLRRRRQRTKMAKKATTMTTTPPPTDPPMIAAVCEGECVGSGVGVSVVTGELSMEATCERSGGAEVVSALEELRGSGELVANASGALVTTEGPICQGLNQITSGESRNSGC